MSPTPPDGAPVSDLFISRDSATWTGPDGVPVFIHRGAIVHRSSPVLQAHPAFFEPLILQIDLEPDLPPTQVSVVIVGGNADQAHGFQYGREHARIVTWRTREAPLYV